MKRVIFALACVLSVVSMAQRPTVDESLTPAAGTDRSARLGLESPDPTHKLGIEDNQVIPTIVTCSGAADEWDYNFLEVGIIHNHADDAETSYRALVVLNDTDSQTTEVIANIPVHKKANGSSESYYSDDGKFELKIAKNKKTYLIKKGSQVFKEENATCVDHGKIELIKQ